MKKPEYAEAWLLGMEKLVMVHDYTKNMNVMIAMFSLKEKVVIWLEDVKCVREIRIEEFS